MVLALAWRRRVRRWSDSWAYTEAKTGVVLDILEQAEDWAAAGRHYKHQRTSGRALTCHKSGRGGIAPVIREHDETELID